MLKNLKINTKIVLSFSVIILSLIIITTLSKNAFSNYVDSIKWNVHTYEVINAFEGLMASMVDMETGQRGFSIVMEEQFLEPYQTGLEKFDESYEFLLQATSDNKEQQENLKKIKELKEEWVKVAEKGMEIARSVADGNASYEAVVEYEAAAHGKTYMDQLREMVYTCENMENELLKQRNQEMDSLYMFTLSILQKGRIICTILALFVGILLSIQITSGLKKVAKAAELTAKGDFTFELKQKSNDEIGKLTGAFISLQSTIKGLINEINVLSDLAISGDLETRGNCDFVDGEYKAIINGINKTLDETTRPIIEAVSVLNEVKEGNLTVKMEGEYQGDHDKIKVAVNGTIASLYDVIGNIQDTSEQVKNSASQVTESSRNIANGSTEQAGVMEEIAASMEEIASQTQKNSEKAEEARAISNETSKLAEEGNVQMKEMMNAMIAIEQSSQQISSIIEVIQDIASQTSMLSLNASIEAARAGDQGRGFAVVAEEVRELAQRSTSATHESVEIIKESLKNVEKGMACAKNVDESLEVIFREISTTASLVDNISEFCTTQSNNVEEVNCAIEQVSSVIQTNASLSEESTAESESMNEQVIHLNNQIAQYRLN